MQRQGAQNILIISKRKLWCESLRALALKSSLKFDLKEVTEDAILLLDSNGFNHRQIKKMLINYNHRSIIFLGSNKNKKEYNSYKNIIGYLSYDVSIQELLSFVQSFVYSTKNITQEMAQTSVLTIEEKLILEALKKGHSNKKIAVSHNIRISHVKYYLQGLYRKLNVSNRVEAALIAQRMIV